MYNSWLMQKKRKRNSYCHLFDWHEVSTLSYTLKDLGKLRVDECIIWNTDTRLGLFKLDRNAGLEAQADRFSYKSEYC